MLRECLAVTACLSLLLAATTGKADDLTASEPHRRVALLVGVNQYLKPGFKDLEFAEADVSAVATELQKLGFETTVLLGSEQGDKQATLANIEAAVRAMVADTGKHDIALVMLSGHGQTLKRDANAPALDESYYCPVDARVNDPTTQLSLSRLLDDILAPNVGRTMVLLDACRDVPVDPTPGARSSKGIEGRVVSLPEDTAIFFSCRAGQMSFEKQELGHGLFTHCVLEALRGQPGQREVAWSDVVAHVGRRMSGQELSGLMPRGMKQVPIPAGAMPYTVLGRLPQPSVVAATESVAAPAASSSAPGAMVRPVPAGNRGLSLPGEIDFASVKPGLLPEGWSGSPVIGVKLNEVPALQLVADATGQAPPQITNAQVRLTGDFFVEGQLLAGNDAFEIHLSSSATGERLDVGLEPNGATDWTAICEGNRFTNLKSTRLSGLVATWFRLEQTSDGVFLLFDGQLATRTKIAEYKSGVFDTLSVGFSKRRETHKLQNLRWGPIQKLALVETKPFIPSVANRQASGLPEGWVRIGGADAEGDRRLAASNLQIGEKFLVDFAAVAEGYGAINLNLIGREGGATLPIHAYFGRGEVELTAAGMRTSFPRQSGTHLFRVRREGEHILVEMNGPANVLAVDATPFGSFERIEVEFVRRNGPISLQELPAVRRQE